jgi:spermidine/putrescine transport system permease protein
VLGRLGRSVVRTRHRKALLLGPATIWLLGLLFVPIGFLVVVSFTITSSETYQIIWEPTVANYVDLLLEEDAPFWTTPFFQAMLFSYFVAAATTVSSLLVTFPVAYLLARESGQVFRVVIYLVLLPFFTIYLVRAYSWFLLFGESGNINQLLTGIGLLGQPHQLFQYGWFAIVVALTHTFVPYMLLTLYASLDGVDFTLLEAARDLGATRPGTLRDILLPLVLPGIISGSVFVFVPSVGAFITPRLLAQGKVQMIGQLIARRVETTYSIGYGSAAAMFIMLSVVAGFVLAFNYTDIEELGGA